MNIIISDEIRRACPVFMGAAVSAKVINSSYDEGLWQDINQFNIRLRENYTNETVKATPSIAATRKVYRTLGKDPSRYRPSGEALARRILGGKSLYQIDTLVDLINLASLTSGYSIGGFDQDKIEGETITLGVGKHEEPYEGIGRGMLNIEGLPVYRDRIGGIGTPTSDNERTKMDLKTSHVLAVINGYDGNLDHVMENANYIHDLLEKYAQAENITIVNF